MLERCGSLWHSVMLLNSIRGNSAMVGLLLSHLLAESLFEIGCKSQVSLTVWAIEEYKRGRAKDLKKATHRRDFSTHPSAPF